MQLYEDLVALDRSVKLRPRVDARERVLNTANRQQGIKARRGDGTFGYAATNESAFAFAWVDAARTAADYGAALVRISREYDRRF